MSLVLYYNSDIVVRKKSNGTIYQSSFYGDVIASSGTAGVIPTKPRIAQRNRLAIAAQHHPTLSPDDKDDWRFDPSVVLDNYHRYMQANMGRLQSHQSLADTWTTVRPFLIARIAVDTIPNVFVVDLLMSPPQSDFSLLFFQSNWQQNRDKIMPHYVRFTARPSLSTSGGQYLFPYTDNIFLPPPATGYRCRFLIIAQRVGSDPFIMQQHYTLLS